MSPIMDAQDRVTGLSVTFDEAMAPASSRPPTCGRFAAGDRGPVGGGPVDSGDGLTFTIDFSNPQALAGTYPVTIGREVLDVAGNEMNQNHDYQNGDGYSGSFEIAAVAVTPNYVQDFETGDFGTLAGWSFSVDSGAGFTSAPSTAMEGSHYLKSTLLRATRRYARANLLVDLSGWDQAEVADIGLPGLAEHELTPARVRLLVSGDGADGRRCRR